MIRRGLGLVMVVAGVYFALDIESGASLFIGMALLSVGSLIFLGPSALFGSGGASGGGENLYDGGDGDGGD